MYSTARETLGCENNLHRNKKPSTPPTKASKLLWQDLRRRGNGKLDRWKKEMEEKMVTETFEEYIKRYQDLIKELGLEPEKYFLQEYLDFVSNRIRDGEKITKSVYENIPDLHYWIQHCYTIHGINVIA